MCLQTWITDGEPTESAKRGPKQNAFEGGFKLGIFTYTKDGKEGSLLISPVAAGDHELETKSSDPVRMPLEGLTPPRSNGSQGLILECGAASNSNGKEETSTKHVRAEIVLSDESDRDILLNGLNACLPYRSCVARLLAGIDIL